MSEIPGPDPDETPPHGIPPAIVAGPERVRVTRSRTSSAPVGGTHYGLRRRRLLRRRGRLVVPALVAVLVLVGFGAWYETEANPPGATGAGVIIDVTPGQSIASVLAQLTQKGVIGSWLAFRLWSVVHGSPTIRPGKYLLHRNESFSTVSAVLSRGPNISVVDVRPGNTLAEVASSLSSLPGTLPGPFLKDARTSVVRSPYQPTPGGSLEGLIGPGDYQVMPGETARQLLTQMVTRFDREAAKAGLAPTTTVGGLDAYQIITTASITQKEGYYTKYFGPVARVIYNRLGDGMMLDMTSTVLYSLGRDGGTVTAADELDPTPYNTYLNPGLTPTPICAPSEAALAAAVAPPPGTWLYFDLVTDKNGTMVFSSTFTGQVAAEQEAAANASTQKGTVVPTTTGG